MGTQGAAPLIGVREMRRQRLELRRRVGRQVEELRAELGVSLADLARCSGLDASYLRRIGRGVGHPSLDALVALSRCLGADVGVRLFPGTGPRIHDRFQAPMIEALTKVLGPGWRARPEDPVPAARGVVDLLLTRVSDACTVVCECHSELRRLELVLRRLAEKTLAVKGGRGRDADVSSMLLLRSTDATRAIARMYEATLAAAFPAKTAEAIAALHGAAPWPGPAIVWARVAGGRAAILDGPPRGVRVGR